jgi:hypothetical protein
MFQGLTPAMRKKAETVVQLAIERLKFKIELKRK